MPSPEISTPRALSGPIRIALVFGTRPEAVKLLPIIRLLGQDPRFAVRVIVTGQHREMVDDVLRPFGISPDADLAIMQPGQSLNEIVSRAAPKLDRLYAVEQPEMVLVQGDTTSAFCAALAAFHRRIKVGHVEAGLRSFDRLHPYPEESNRRMVSAVADLHFAPTKVSANNLVAEGVARERVVITGNTVIDALLLALREEGFLPERDGSGGMRDEGEARPVVLVTLHRREAWEGVARGGRTTLEEILCGIRQAAEDHPHVDFVYPVHPNPKVREAAKRSLGDTGNVALIAPLSYLPFVRLMATATAIVTDSGGVQEEAPSLGVPVLVLRKTTERPEGISAGANKLVGTESADIRRELRAVLLRPRSPSPTPSAARRIPCPSPFGDGRASERTLEAILAFMGLGPSPEEFHWPESASRPSRNAAASVVTTPRFAQGDSIDE